MNGIAVRSLGGLLLAVTMFWGCAAPPADPEASSATAAPAAAGQPVVEWALAIHGGAGVRREGLAAEEEPAYREALEAALRQGQEILAGGGTALDAVEQVVRVLEDDPLFNAGRGAVFTSAGTNELDAAIMDGRDLDCGSVSGITRVRNPISLARKVMAESRHVFLSGAGAETFASSTGIELVEPDYFFVQRRFDALQKAQEKERRDEEASRLRDGTKDRSTVGAVALDKHGNLAAATSTGGMTNKRFGRVGDVPIIGAGTYANNRTAAISCTGWGEKFIRNTVAYQVSARVEFGGETLQQAVDHVIDDVLDVDDGGLIAVGADGSIVLGLNTEGMFRGAADADGRFEVRIWKDESP